MIPAVKRTDVTVMKMRKMRAPFSEAAQLKICLAVFSPAIQAEAAAVIADPAKAASWGKTLEMEIRSLVDRTYVVCQDSVDLIGPGRLTLEAVQASLEAAAADRFNDTVHDGLGTAVGALTAAARPLQRAYRDILVFVQRKPALAKELDDYIRAAGFLPRSKEMHDRLCYLSGLAEGLEIFSKKMALDARTVDLREAMRSMGPALKTLPRECQDILKNYTRDKEVLAHGLPAEINVGKPLRFRQ